MFETVTSLFEKGDAASVEALTLFFDQNYGKITRQSECPNYENSRKLYASILYLCKKDSNIRAFVEQALSDIDANDLKHGLYCYFYGITGNACRNGKYKKLYKSPFKLVFCGNDSTCACKREEHSAKAQARTPEAKAAIQSKKVATYKSKLGVENPMLDAGIVNKMRSTAALRTNKEKQASLESRKKTSINRYGTEHPAASNIVKERIKDTLIERYGVTNPGLVSEFIEKGRTTYEAKTGYNHVWSNPEVIGPAREKFKQKWPETKKRIVENNQKTWGADFPMQVPEYASSRRKIFLEKYGVDNPGLVPEFRAKATQTRYLKTGYTHQWSDPSVREKMRQSLFDRSGVFHHNHLHLTPTALSSLADKSILEELLNLRSARSVSDDLGIDYSTLCKACARHGIQLQGSRSSYEREIEAFLIDLGVEYISNTRAAIGWELDFVIPEHGIAIEFNGLYYHSDTKHGQADTLYHRKKWEACRDIELQLVSINEDEWIERANVIKRKIANLCGASKRGPGARKLKIREISAADAQAFVTIYHIQGATGAILHSIGAYENDRLVSVMTFGKQRSTGLCELTRFCTDGSIYAGVFSRLFRHAVDNFSIDHVVTFADLRYSLGRVYEKNGFEADGEIRPDYRYVKGIKTFHKSHFSKNKIKSRGIDIENQTESELAKSLGFSRIFDCGKIRYVWKRPT